MVAAAIALLLALSWGGVRYGWGSPQILGLIARLGAAVGAVRVAADAAPEPFIPLAMVREPVVFGIVVAGFFCIGTIIGLSIFMPLYIELVLGLSRERLGRRADRLHGGATLGSMMAGRLMSRLERYKRVPIVGLPLGIAMLVVVRDLAGRAFARWQVAVLLAVGGLGLGPMYPTTTVIIQNAVPLHQLGIATGTLNFFRQLGGAIIVAVFGAIVLGGVDGRAAGASRSTSSRAPRGPVDFAPLFRLVFIAAAVFLTVALRRGGADRGAAAARTGPGRRAAAPAARTTAAPTRPADRPLMASSSLVRHCNPRGCGAMLQADLARRAAAQTFAKCDDVDAARTRAVAVEAQMRHPRRAAPLAARRAEAARPLTKTEIRRVFYGLMLGGFLSAVNQTIVATALPTIGRDLGDFHNLSWVIIAYLLSSTVVAPLYGKLSRHPRPPRHDADRARPVHRRLGASARGAQHGDADRRRARCRASAAAASCRWCRPPSPT